MNSSDLREFPWATAGLVLLTVIVAIVGGLVVIFGDKGTLSFSEYLDDLVKFAFGLGLLGIGRGIRSGLIKHRK